MATPSARRPPHQPKATLEVIDPRWLLKALGLVIGIAAVCAYLAVCLLVYQGSWQFLLHPSAAVDTTPSIPFQAIRFDAAETGQPRLTGWWIPADTASAPTILFLHDGSRSLSATVPTLELLHQANVNIFAIDYRGFGLSGPPHPTESRMAEDSAAALEYLADTRHIPASSIIPYGQGLGAVLAAHLAAAHPELPAMIAEDPDPQAYERAIHDPRTRLLPMHLLMQEHFDIGRALSEVKQPKLLLTEHNEQTTSTETLFHDAPDPKFIVTFPRPRRDAAYLDSIHRFLDEYVAGSTPFMRGGP